PTRTMQASCKTTAHRTTPGLLPRPNDLRANALTLRVISPDTCRCSRGEPRHPRQIVARMEPTGRREAPPDVRLRGIREAPTDGAMTPDCAEPVLGLAEHKTRGLHPGYARALNQSLT